MNLLTYKYHQRSKGSTDPILLKLAKEREFREGFKADGNYGKQKQWIDLFNGLFFRGGRLAYKESITVDEKSNVMSYLIEYMAGCDSDHNDKTAICAMLLSEIVDLEKCELNK